MLLLSSTISYARDNTQEQEIAETEVIQVVGRKHQNSSSPAGKTEFIDINQLSSITPSVAQLVTEVPGIALSGQGGLFQVYAMRGLSGPRVQTQLSGIPIHSERRAGTAASFISPYLIDHIEVLKGSVSTLYGSGALAGIVQITPRHFDQLSINTSFQSGDNLRNQSISWGNEKYSIAINHSQADNGKTASGDSINNQYEQTSATFLSKWQLSDSLNMQFLLLPSYGQDIGKVNSDDYINKKFTLYPEEKHLISQITLLGDNWQSSFSVHNQELETYVERFNKRINHVDTQAIDYNASFLMHWRNNNFSGQWGLDQQFRDKVKATEIEQNLNNFSEQTNTNLNASQYDGAIFSSINWHYNQLTLSTGARLNYIKQNSHQLNVTQSNSKSDQAWTGFINAGYSFTPKWKLSTSVSSGFRFASLSERFYSGTTGRGQVIGNLDLLPETSTDLSATLDYQADDQQFQLSIFSNNIKNYIERVTIDDNTRSYQNLHNGNIIGAELNYNQQLSDSFSYQLSGHYLQGRDEQDEYLSNISANKLQLSMNYQETHWQASLTLEHRFANNNVTPNEQPLDCANVIEANWLVELNEQWYLTFWAENLLNDSYTLTSDKKSSLSSQRQFGIRLSWQMN